MAFDSNSLAQTHTPIHLQIQSNTQISSRATAVISKLSTGTSSTSASEESKTSTTAATAATPAKPPLVILQAQSRWASKLISIVEIAKRDLQARGIGVWQYSALSSEIVEIDRKPRPNAGVTGTNYSATAAAATAENAHESDDEAFQTMSAEAELGKKKRAVPVLTVYLAAQPVKVLRSLYGEQKSS